MNLRAIVERGFSSANLAAGGAQDGPKWYSEKNQVFLRNEMRELMAAVDALDRDADLSEQGRARKKIELARATLEKIRAESIERFASVIVKKRDQFRQEAAAATSSAGSKDALTLILQELRDQRRQSVLMQMDPADVRIELQRAVDRGDADTYRCISGLLPFELQRVGLLPEVLRDAQDRWMSRTAPALGSALKEAETAAQLADENLQEAERAIREFASLPDGAREHVKQFQG